MELLSSKWSDILLETKDQKNIPTSKFLLASRSPVFKMALEADFECKKLTLNYSFDCIHMGLLLFENGSSFSPNMQDCSHFITVASECLLFYHAYEIFGDIHFYLEVIRALDDGKYTLEAFCAALKTAEIIKFDLFLCALERNRNKVMPFVKEILKQSNLDFLTYFLDHSIQKPCLTKKRKIIDKGTVPPKKYEKITYHGYIKI